jgi:hypothetical protein
VERVTGPSVQQASEAREVGRSAGLEHGDRLTPLQTPLRQQLPDRVETAKLVADVTVQVLQPAPQLPRVVAQRRVGLTGDLRLLLTARGEERLLDVLRPLQNRQMFTGRCNSRRRSDSPRTVSP